ncbi:MAG: superoxide dismutase [Cu-Zn] SodC [Vibrionaceae bacterium]
MKKRLQFCVLMLLAGTAHAKKDTTVTMQDLNSGKRVGVVTISQTEYGMVFTPKLRGVSPGLHGFHVHTNPSCGPLMNGGKKIVGGAAGGHYDPQQTGKHGYPWTNDNHLGDLPALYVDHSGRATYPVLAPRLKPVDVKGRSLMIHVGSDNHSDHPSPLGGGGDRIICGVIK